MQACIVQPVIPVVWVFQEEDKQVQLGNQLGGGGGGGGGDNLASYQERYSKVRPNRKCRKIKNK